MTTKSSEVTETTRDSGAALRAALREIMRKVSHAPMAEQAQLQTVTPAIAAEWLKKSQCCQPISLHRVVHYAKLMWTGDWQVSDDPICFDVGGRLVNGRHRLLAVIESGISFEFMVMRSEVDQGSEHLLEQAHAAEELAAIAWEIAPSPTALTPGASTPALPSSTPAAPTPAPAPPVEISAPASSGGLPAPLTIDHLISEGRLLPGGELQLMLGGVVLAVFRRVGRGGLAFCCISASVVETSGRGSWARRASWRARCSSGAEALSPQAFLAAINAARSSRAPTVIWSVGRWHQRRLSDARTTALGFTLKTEPVTVTKVAARTAESPPRTIAGGTRPRTGAPREACEGRAR